MRYLVRPCACRKHNNSNYRTGRKHTVHRQEYDENLSTNGMVFQSLRVFGNLIGCLFTLASQIVEDSGRDLKRLGNPSEFSQICWKKRILNLGSHAVKTDIHFIWHSWLLFSKTAFLGIRLGCAYRERDIFHKELNTGLWNTFLQSSSSCCEGDKIVCSEPSQECVFPIV